MCRNEEFMESWWQNLIIAIIPSALTAIVTLLLSKQSQINKNTEALNKLSEKLGLNNKKINDKFKTICDDIGRNDNSSLTKQHMNIEKTISHSFEVIAKRYENEDIVYRQFTAQQKDLKNTLDSFSRDYYEHIKNENILYEKCYSLECKNKKLIVENEKLKKQIIEITHKIDRNHERQREDHEIEL